MQQLSWPAILLIVFVSCTIGCRDAGVPQPIVVLENPTTGERARFYREIPYKVPADYDEAEHIREWTNEKKQAGFTKEIAPEDDREALTKLHAENRAKAQRQ
jgi:hypothetical protein